MSSLLSGARAVNRPRRAAAVQGRAVAGGAAGGEGWEAAGGGRDKGAAGRRESWGRRGLAVHGE